MLASEPNESSWIDDFIASFFELSEQDLKELIFYRLDLYEQLTKDGNPNHFFCGIFSSLAGVKKYLETIYPYEALKKGMTFRLQREQVDNPFNPDIQFKDYEI